MAKKLGEGGNGLEEYSVETGQYISESVGNISESVGNLGLKITGKGDLESASQKIIEENKDKIINNIKKIIGLEDIKDIQPNPKTSNNEKNDDNHGIDYYLITGSGSVSGVDDKTGVNTKNFVFEIFKNVNGKEVTAWFTNKYKRNDFLLFGNLKTDENSNVTGCEYDFFDMSCLADCVYNCLGITDPNTNPDNFLYAIGRKFYNNAKFGAKNELKFSYRDKGKIVSGVYVRIKNKTSDKRGPTVSVTIEIDKNKIREMCEDDEHQFISL